VTYHTLAAFRSRWARGDWWTVFGSTLSKQVEAVLWPPARPGIGIDGGIARRCRRDGDPVGRAAYPQLQRLSV